jgi:regulator of RNase E activity RraA
LMEKDDILVCDIGGQPVSHAGGLASRAMKLRGVSGMVIDGGCRDIDEIISVGLPTYTRHVTATTGQFSFPLVTVNVPLL